MLDHGEVIRSLVSCSLHASWQEAAKLFGVGSTVNEGNVSATTMQVRASRYVKIPASVPVLYS